MARDLVCGLTLAAIVAVALQGCGKPSPGRLDRPAQPVAAQAATVDLPASPDTLRARKTSERLPAGSAHQVEQYPTDDPPPWLAELLQAPDPNVRIQALDAWARQPGHSLDSVTYALVDPDESVRTRAQEVWEQELARR
jgi:hypothetical protein